MKNPRPTPGRLREVFDYCHKTGVLTRKSNPEHPVGRQNSGGYLLVSVDGHSIGVHRVAFALMKGRWPRARMVVHHIDGCRTNNAWHNLIETTSRVNNIERKLFTNNTSGFRGVSPHKNSPKYEASIKRCGQKYYLGLHASAEEAARVYELAAQMFRDMELVAQLAKDSFVPLNPC